MNFQTLFSQHPILYVLHFLFCAAGAFILCRFSFQTLKEINRRPYSFYITDIWVAILCLLPFFLLIRDAAEAHVEPTLNNVYPLAASVLSECVGMMMGLAFSWPEEGQQMTGRLRQAGWIIWGAFMGLMAISLATIVFLVLVTGVILLMSCPPPCFVLGILAILCRMRRPRKNN